MGEYIKYTEEDVEFLKEHYPNKDWDLIFERFPNSTKDKIKTKCYKLGIKIREPSNKRIDMIGKKFSRLLVISRADNDNEGRTRWWCKCDCGYENLVCVSGKNLRNGSTKSCGCLQKESVIKRNYRHGFSGDKHADRICKIFYGMKKRCYNENYSEYMDYGGRGIKISDEWLNNTESFVKWALANGYSEGLSIDRIDVNGNYEPANCRWADYITQANNKRNNRYILINGSKYTIRQISDLTKIKFSQLSDKFYRDGEEKFIQYIENILNKETINERE